ncbi:hypothetical protein B484DRAFT_331127 [Ochromonadaceae sp. CCMP2298]|nr:hypothetical protein B484DRAFT_331127 [Ochromonadaceae sp. CCMP2298]
MGNSDSHPSRNPESGGRSSSSTQQPPPQQQPTSTTAFAGQATAGAAAPQQNPSTAGAFKMPGAPRNQRFYVTIPRGVRPGQHFAVLVNGQQMMVKCPEANRPGDRLIVAAPRTQQQFVVTVPPNVKPGQQFRVMINNQEVMVTCPRGVKPGQRVTFQLPHPQERAPQAAPNHQMFEVTVPDGVKPGQPFALIANGQRVMVTCPPNVKPGQKIRFQLPIQLTQQQLESVRVNYDKDGWMRCLGQDLKFHWLFNEADGEGRAVKPDEVTEYDENRHAFVRQFTDDPVKPIIEYIPAAEYAIETSVKGTSINYQELNQVAAMPFKEKCDWLKAQFANLRVPWEEGHIKLKVRRGSLLQDAMDAIESIEAADMRKIFRFEFLGEPALDAGGVAREFFAVISEQLFNPDCGLFLYSAVNQMCMQINPNSGIANEMHLRYFHMAGRILGKALMDGQITPVHLIQPLYKHLMGWPVTFKDLEHIDDQVYRNLAELTKMEDVSCLYLDFVVTEDHLGVTEAVELVPGGGDMTVDNANLADYLDAQLKYRTMYRIKDQLAEFLKGFYDIVPEPLLSVFDFQEVELLLHGLPNIEMEDWIKNTEYTGDFANNSGHTVSTHKPSFSQAAIAFFPPHSPLLLSLNHPHAPSPFLPPASAPCLFPYLFPPPPF